MKMEQVGSELVIRIPLNVKLQPSKSGKSMVIASTNGFTNRNTDFGDVKIGLNVITTDTAYGKGDHLGAGAPKLVKTAAAAN
jgi:hypothetical protein